MSNDQTLASVSFYTAAFSFAELQLRTFQFLVF